MTQLEIDRALDGLRILERRLAAVLAETGLNVSQFRLLQTCELPSTVSVLSRRRGISKASVTNLVKELEQVDVLRVRPNPGDRRSVLVELTATGRERLGIACQDVRALERSLTGKLPRTDVTALNRLVETLACGGKG